MTHLKHALAVIVPLVIAGAGAIAASPAWTNFVEHHAATAGIVVAIAGALRAAWKAIPSNTATTTG